MERQDSPADHRGGAGKIPFRLRLSAEAEEDLRAIWRYSVSEWGVVQADAYVSDLLSAFDFLCERPRIGSTRVARRITYRRWLVGKHAIYYRLGRSQVVVTRILHAAMDARRHLR